MSRPAPSLLLVALLTALGVAGVALPAQSNASPAVAASSPREHLLMDSGWRFAFGHPSDPQKDFDHATSYFSYLTKAGYGDGPAAEKFDDSAWRQLDLPHDWAVEAPFDNRGSHSHGYKAIGRNFPERSVGWYRKTFTVPATDLGRRIGIEFDGVFRESVVWINGFYLGRQPSGYTGFRYDLTDYLNYGGENVISVRADVTLEEGWFYEGAGIYRHVWLNKTAPLHVAPYGTFVTTEVQNESAMVTVRTTLINEGSTAARFDIDQEIFSASGQAIATESVKASALAAGVGAEYSSVLKVANPQLWSLESPTLHRLVTTIRSGGTLVDRYETTFGIRTVRFDPNEGFFLNDRHVLLKGTNNHQDHAGVGTAVPDALQDFRIARLKEMGVNAYRCSHHPPAPELLEACDRLGMLVIDENRLMGPSPEQLNQLEQMILRDRNHPSVILWSLGNEEWAIEGNLKGARITATMTAFAQRLDPTRRSTVAISGGWGGTSTTVDVVGYNYINQADPDKQHAKFPQQPGVGTEETTTQGTRGIYFDDRPNAHLSPQPKGDSGGNCEKGWQYYAARPFLAGLFFWTGFDSRGESTPFSFPAVSSQFGLMDSCGFPKDSYYFLQSWWTDQPVLHLFPHWNWPGKEGQPINVWCYSNCDEVELMLNGQTLGKKIVPRNSHLEWNVPYQPGALEARGFRGGKQTETTRVETTGAPTKIILTPDRAKISANGEDISVVTIQVVDAAGHTVPTADNLVTFELEGPGHLLGVGNGDPVSHEPDRFVAALQLLLVENWRGRIVPAGTAAPSASESQLTLPQLANWQAPLPKAGEIYDLSASFSLGTLPADGQLHLHLPSLGLKTTVWLNGHELARDLDTSHTGPIIALEAKQLVDGVNRVQLIVAPFTESPKHLPELTRLGVVQIRTPTPVWQRQVFNGYAQVLVQAEKTSGSIRLTTHAKNLPSASVSLTAAPAAARPSVP